MLITVVGKPSQEALLHWQSTKKEIIFTSYDIWSRENIVIKGIIKKIERINKTDLVIWVNNHPFEIYLQDMVSYAHESIILNETDKVNAIVLKIDDYTVRVNKEALANRCEYFKNLFHAGMSESSLDEIDLSFSFDQKMLEVLIKFLDGQYDELHSLNDGLALLVVGDFLCSQEIIEKAFKLIEEKFTLTKFNQLTLKKDELHPLIASWVANLQIWLNKYDKIIFHGLKLNIDFFLCNNAEEYEKEMQDLVQKLKAITNVDWIFDGINFKSTSISSFNNEPHHSNHYSNKILQILIARGILAGQQDTYSRWACRIKDSNKLAKLDIHQLRKEITEASQLLGEITESHCNCLSLHPVPCYLDFKILEEIGCIKVAYYALDTKIVDFNIEKLCLLKNEAITLSKLRKRYQYADKTKPLFNQIFKQVQTLNSEKNNSIATSKYSLLADKTNNSATGIATENVIPQSPAPTIQ